MQRIHERSPRPADLKPQNYKTTPYGHAPTIRTDYKRLLSSGFGGKFLPLLALPLLREDRLLRSTFRFGFEMNETASMLMNPVRIAVHAWLVPKLAFERFQDLGHLNRSYLKQPEIDSSVTDWFTMIDPYDGGSEISPILKTLGMHVATGSNCNSDYIEAYNAIWNYIAVETSPSLTKRAATALDLAPAFWKHNMMRHVKPTFDQALLHGEVPLNVVAAEMPVHGLYVNASAASSIGDNPYRDQEGDVASGLPTGTYWAPVVNARGSSKSEGFGPIYAELQENGITVSLANLELAKRTAAFARARQAYQGLDDDQVIDILMSGVRMPEEGMKHPILLGTQETVFGMSQRYATDAGNLEKSVTRGQTMVDLTVGTPQINTGGVVMFVAEILPEQLFERQEDPALMLSDQALLPDRLRDELDLEPVEVVKNGEVDVDHTDPTGVFGYAPLNHRWQRDIPNIGGRYHRPDADAPWSEDRNRIWAVETVDPVLGDDFYLASNIHHEVFADTLTDPFELTANGVARIEGLTFFGPALRESDGDYEAVAGKADFSRIDLAE